MGLSDGAFIIEGWRHVEVDASRGQKNVTNSPFIAVARSHPLV